MGYLLKYVVPLFITVLLCRLLFVDVDFGEMWVTVRDRCHFEFIVIALCVSIFSHIFRAMRWRIQLQALNIAAPLFTLVLSIFGTYAVNLVLPRLGELWRTAYVAKRQKAEFSTVFGSMVADRFADSLTVLLLLVVALFLSGLGNGTFIGEDTVMRIGSLISSPWIWLGFAAIISLIWWILKKHSGNALFLKIKHFIRGLWAGFAIVATMPGRGRWLLLTACIWGCYFFQLYIAFFAFDFTAQIVHTYGLVAVLVTFVLSSLSMAVPSNGGIGPWQWSVIIALGLYGLDKAQGTIFANLVMGTQTILLIVLGLFTFGCIALQKKQRV